MLFRSERHGDYIVSGVSRGGECAAALAGLVDRTQEVAPLGYVLAPEGLQPHLGGRHGDKAAWSAASRGETR